MPFSFGLKAIGVFQLKRSFSWKFARGWISRTSCVLRLTLKMFVWSGDSSALELWRDVGFKPIALAARALSNHDASVVLDPFLGAGSTLLAAEQAGRMCLGMEIDPYYVQVCLDRFAAAGLPATLLRKGDR